MQLTIIRHLETSWNRQGVLQGSQDIGILPVSHANKVAINENKKKFSDITYDFVLVSPYKRTQQTAAAYGITKTMVEPLLSEVDFGAYEGATKAGMVKDYGQAWYDDPRKGLLGTEFIEMEVNINVFCEKYKGYQHILAFGHGSWMRGLHSILEFGDISRMNQFVIKNNQLCNLELNKEVMNG